MGSALVEGSLPWLIAVGIDADVFVVVDASGIPYMYLAKWLEMISWSRESSVAFLELRDPHRNFRKLCH
jgi:hypothetical protein